MALSGKCFLLVGLLTLQAAAVTVKQVTEDLEERPFKERLAAWQKQLQMWEKLTHAKDATTKDATKKDAAKPAPPPPPAKKESASQPGAPVAAQQAQQATAQHDYIMGALRKEIASLETDPKIAALVKATTCTTCRSAEPTDIWYITQKLVEEYASPDYPLHNTPAAMRGFASTVCLRLEKYGREGQSNSIDPKASEIKCGKFEGDAITLMLTIQDYISWKETDPQDEIFLKRRIFAGYLVRAAIMSFEDNKEVLWKEYKAYAQELIGFQLRFESFMGPAEAYVKKAKGMTSLLRTIAKSGGPKEGTEEPAFARLAKVQWALADWGASWKNISDNVGHILDNVPGYLFNKAKHSGMDSTAIEAIDDLVSGAQDQHAEFTGFIEITMAKTIGLQNSKSEYFNKPEDQLEAIQHVGSGFQQRVVDHSHAAVTVCDFEITELIQQCIENEIMANMTVAPKIAVQEEHPADVADDEDAAAVDTARADLYSKISPADAAGLVKASTSLRDTLSQTLSRLKAIHYDLLDSTNQVVKALRTCTKPYLNRD